MRSVNSHLEKHFYDDVEPLEVSHMFLGYRKEVNIQTAKLPQQRRFKIVFRRLPTPESESYVYMPHNPMLAASYSCFLITASLSMFRNIEDGAREVSLAVLVEHLISSRHPF